MKIAKGPFMGHQPAAGEVGPMHYRDGSPVLGDDGEPVLYWGVHARTGNVLDVFPPAEGWAVVVTNRKGDYAMTDHATQVVGEDGVVSPAVQPTVLFTASLISPTGVTVATASTMRIINGTGAWEAGETKARARLYEALGLAGATDGEEASPADPPAPTEAVKTVDAVPASWAKQEAKAEAAPASSADTNADTTEAEAVAEAVAEAEVEAEVVVETKPAAKKTKAAKTAKTAKTKREDGELNANLLRQVKHRAGLTGTELPDFKSNEELTKFWKSLVGRAA